MRIGLDIRPLQGHHKVRGIGVHIKILVQWILNEYKGDDVFVFYVYKDLPNPIHNFAKKNLNYEFVYLSDYRNFYPLVPTIISAGIAYIRRVLTPIPTKLAKKCDVLLGFDFMLGMPRKGDVRYVLVGYDLIQILYGNYYLPGFWKSKGKVGTRQAIFSFMVSTLYRKAVASLRHRGVRLLAISNSSKEQFMKLANIPGKLIRVIYLGNPIANSHFKANQDDLLRVRKFEKNSYILFIGGADWRRKLDDVVAAYNLLRARGHDMKLIFAGFDFQSIDTIITPSTRDAIKNSSYREDIHLLGYINDSEKQYLYQNALCFAFPSVCEGFGLPILEAMQEGCPVIAYSGQMSSIPEVAGEGGIIVDSNHIAIYRAVEDLTTMTSKQKKELIEAGLNNLNRFSWDICARETIAALKDPAFINP